MGFAGDERTTRRAVAEAKAAWFVGAAARWQARPRRSPIERRRSDNAVEAGNPSGPRGY
jgi:hypothetical protein